ncbi:MAG: VanW family protein [Armatimonadetes bacterium]|nr:VanW family protein [Armatimonadota bacterium]
MCIAALRSVTCRLLPLAGLTLLCGGAPAAPGLLPSLLPTPPPLLTLLPTDQSTAPAPAPGLVPPRRSWIGDATTLEESVSETRWTARASWLLERTDDPSLQLANWGDVLDIALLGAFDIPLRSDPAERANILLSARAVDGVEVDPGQVFSFNATVGERTPERGYQDGWMFDHGQLVRGTGGGICLVATGLYNAALRAGLGIAERHPHSGLVSYAPPGCDAGVVYGVEDMKFRNTTPAPLLVKAQAADDHVTLQLFGHTPPPGEEVIVKPTFFEPLPAPTIRTEDPTLQPGQVVVAQKPRAGFDVTVERFWTEHHQIVRREVVAQEHRAPRPRLLRVAPPPPPADPLAQLLLGGPMPDDASDGA